ncbi:MAG: type II secretion system F family protein [Methanobrevibacter sp.]|jgi:flagellar protein FlaJ|nr:type II secretion system F family protein [Candidatus Methanoflexus mossambicus]
MLSKLILIVLNIFGSLFYNIGNMIFKLFNSKQIKDKNHVNIDINSNYETNINIKFNDINKINNVNNEENDNDNDNDNDNNNNNNNNNNNFDVFDKIKNLIFIENEEEIDFKSIHQNNRSNQSNQNMGDISGILMDSNNLGHDEFKANPLLFLNSIFLKITKEISSENFLKRLNLRFILPTGLIFTLTIFLILNILFSLEIALIFIVIIFLIAILITFFPKLQKSKKNENIIKEIPYALRQMVTELRSGKGIYDTISSISKSDYGELSKEFQILIEEIKYGRTVEDALINLGKRVNSEKLNRIVYQIISTTKTGGNLANSLNIIAEDVSNDMHIEIKEYSQKLNGFILIYTFLAILAPVLFLIMIIAASTVMGEIIPSNLLLIMYIVFFPMIVIFMGLMIKRMEPKM